MFHYRPLQKHRNILVDALLRVIRPSLYITEPYISLHIYIYIWLSGEVSARSKPGNTPWRVFSDLQRQRPVASFTKEVNRD